MARSSCTKKAPYDPVKAHEYYMRNRKLKGPTGGVTFLKKTPVKSQAALDNFLKKLPMAIEGADLKKTKAFVDSYRGKPDEELRKAAKKHEGYSRLQGCRHQRPRLFWLCLLTGIEFESRKPEQSWL